MSWVNIKVWSIPHLKAFIVGWGDEVSLHENSHSHSRSLRVFEVEVRGFKIFEAFLRLRVM